MADPPLDVLRRIFEAAPFIQLTVEFKVNFLNPASGDRLASHARVLKAGRTFVVAESEVFAEKRTGEVLVARAMVTLAVVSASS